MCRFVPVNGEEPHYFNRNVAIRPDFPGTGTSPGARIVPCVCSPMTGAMSDPASPDSRSARGREATWAEVVPAVLSSFLGIRKGKAMREDAVSIRPHQVIVVGVATAAIFVVCLVLFVRFIIRTAGA